MASFLNHFFGHFLVAGGVAMGDKPFWKDLLQRGGTTPSAHPRQWHDEAEFARFISGQLGEDRHFILVSLAGRS